MEKIRPLALKPDDTIRIVSPASPILPEELAAGKDLLENAGYRVEIGQHVFDKVGYLAGTDQDRASDTMDAFLNPNVRAVLCSRGGYGCPRLMPYLDLGAIVRSKKMFLGFSDITTIHVALNKLGLSTFYSPMGGAFNTPREEWVIRSFLNALSGENPFDVPYPRAKCIVPGIAVGETVGGCMVPFMDSLATPDEIDMDGKILLIEDVGERAHRIDALITHLLRTGKIQKCSGIVIGEMTGTDKLSQVNPDGKPSELYKDVTWRDIVGERLSPLGIPMVIDFPFGHLPQMLTVPLGIPARLMADDGVLDLQH